MASDLFTMAKMLQKQVPVAPKPPDVSQFVQRVTSNVRLDPGVQSRQDQALAPNSPAIQQQAYQAKLNELGNWSKGITSTLREGAIKRAAKGAVSSSIQAQRTPTARPGSSPIVRAGGGGAGVTNTRGWNGYANGQIPVHLLSGVSFNPNVRLRREAAQGLEAMNAAYRQATGRNIGITDSYRTLQGQINVARRKPGFAARPGTSVHGLGAALDLNVKGDPQLKRWLDANAGRFGFVNPNWAKNPRRYEPWHWEFTG